MMLVSSNTGGSKTEAEGKVGASIVVVPVGVGSGRCCCWLSLSDVGEEVSCSCKRMEDGARLSIEVDGRLLLLDC